MDNILAILQPLARRAIQTVKDALEPFTTVYPTLPTSQAQTLPRSPHRIQPSRSMSPLTMPSTPTPQMSIMYASLESSSLYLPQRAAMERMYACSISTSRSSSPTFLAGSEFILPTKTHLTPDSQVRPALKLHEAISQPLSKSWPLIEERFPALGQESEVSVKEKVRKGVTKLEDSKLFVKDLTQEERKRKDEIMKKWKEKDERDIGNRKRVQDGLEDILDNEGLAEMWGMRPTLEGHIRPKVPSKRYFKESKTGKEPETKQENEKGMDSIEPRGGERQREKSRGKDKKERRPQKSSAPFIQTTNEHQPRKQKRLEPVQERQEPSKTPRRITGKPVFRYKEESDDDTLPFLARK